MAGFIALYKTKQDTETVQKMMQTIKYRGEDIFHQYKDENLIINYINYATGYRFDEQEYLETHRHVFLVIGYINNFEELRSNFETKEQHTITSPIEAIAKLYKTENLEKIANQLKGSYVILIYDKETNELSYIRDRFSVQPMYYYPTENGVIIASEIKAMLEHPEFKKEFNKEALVPYLVFQSSNLKETFFKGVFNMSPATYGVFKGNKLQEYTYWDIEFDPISMTMDQAVQSINDLIGQSIENRKNNFKNEDNVCQMLSGGVDSSYLAARVRPNKTFTVGYSDKEFSEIDNARDLSKIIGADHYATLIDFEEALEEISEIAYLADLPLGNQSIVPMYYLAKSIKEHTHTVYSGEGADEFFGGYYYYTEPKYINLYKKLPLSVRRLLGEKMLKSEKDFKGKNFIMRGLPSEYWYLGQSRVFHESEAKALVREDFKQAPSIASIVKPFYDRVKDKSEIQKRQYIDFHFWLINDINLKADRMNVGNGIQLITPIFDENVLEFARHLPDELKVKGEQGKIAFRQASLEYLPEDWATRRKVGYVFPIRKWLQSEENAELINDKLLGDISQKFFDTKMIEQLLNEHKSGTRAQHTKLWTIYMFINWYEEYFIKR